MITWPGAVYTMQYVHVLPFSARACVVAVVMRRQAMRRGAQHTAGSHHTEPDAAPHTGQRVTPFPSHTRTLPHL